MFPLTIRVPLQTLLIVFLLSLAYGHDRQIFVNPGCQPCNSSSIFTYIRADGSHDSIHQIWDFTRGMPTVIYAITNLNTTMDIKWDHFRPDSITFKETPTYSFAAAIDRLYEYEDCNDLGHIDGRCPQRALSLRNVLWKREDSILTNDEVMISMHGLYKEGSTTGIINIKLDLLPFEDYAVELPRLIHTANSSLIDISLVDFTTSLNSSRYSVHFVMVSTDNRTDTMNYTLRKSLDDEHTPGVFEIIEVKTPRSRTSGLGGYIQFRPVAYTEKERSVSSSTNAYISTFNRTVLPSRSTLLMFYQDFPPNNLLKQDMFISFGLPGDGFYKQHNFTSWSFTYGYGSPPIEGVSLFVVIIIAVGLGVPVLLAVSGIVYVFVRRCRQRRNRPERFIDDE